jgi:WhiB family redox-sensing transcriptional regulator
VVNHNDQDRLRRIVERLDRLIDVPTEVLAGIVKRDGLCLWAVPEGDPPELTGRDTPDRELASWLCAGCPVQDECLELDLRWAGPDTVGVWGALPEQDRRDLYPLWRARGHTPGRPGNGQTGRFSGGEPR